MGKNRLLKRTGALLCALVLLVGLLPVTALAYTPSTAKLEGYVHHEPWVKISTANVNGAGGESTAVILFHSYDYNDGISSKDAQTAISKIDKNYWEALNAYGAVAQWALSSPTLAYETYWDLPSGQGESVQGPVIAEDADTINPLPIYPWMVRGVTFFYPDDDLSSDSMCLNQIDFRLFPLGIGNNSAWTAVFNGADLAAAATQYVGHITDEEAIKRRNEGGYIGKNYLWLHEDVLQAVTLDMSEYTTRWVSDLGSFDDGGKLEDLVLTADASGSSSNLGRGWDNQIADQYSGHELYNPTGMPDSPIYSVTTSHASFNSLVTANSDNNMVGTPKSIYNKMFSTGVHDITISETLTFQGRSTNANSGVGLQGDSDNNLCKTNTRRIYTPTYQLGTPSISAGQTTGNRTYYNKDYVGKTITITLPVKSVCMHTSDDNGPISKSTVASALKCTAELYAGEEKIDIKVTKSSSGDNVKFTATIPDDVQYSNSLRLVLSGMYLDGYSNYVQTSTDGKTKMVGNFEYQFSSTNNNRYLDTKAPVVAITATDATFENVIDVTKTPLLPAQSFYAKVLAKEEFYPTGTQNKGHTAENKNTATYYLTDSQGARVPFQLTGANVTSEGATSGITADGVKINVTAAENAPLSDVYTLHVAGQDDAGNPAEATFNAPLDTVAPDANVKLVSAERDATGTKIAKVSVSITDFCNLASFKGAYSRLYYYISTNGAVPTENAKGALSNATGTGAIEEITDKWLYVDSNGLTVNDRTVATTIALTVPAEKVLQGTLYWYTEDTAGNDNFSNLENQEKREEQTLDLNINNITPEDVRLTDDTVTTPAATLNEHKIGFDLSRTADGKSYTYEVKYQWDGAEEGKWLDYTANSGLAAVDADLGETPRGAHTLYYQVTRSDGADKIFQQTYQFDNVPITEDHLQISFNAITPAFSSGSTPKEVNFNAAKANVGIASASYRVVTSDDKREVISGVLNLEQNASGLGVLTQEEVTLTMPENTPNGIYFVELSATDTNGNSGTVARSFLWRTEAPTVGALSVVNSEGYQTLPSGQNKGAIFVGPDNKFTLSVDVTETFDVGVGLLDSNPLKAYYSISLDNGATWGAWTKSDAVFAKTAGTDTYTATVQLTPTLSAGRYNIQVKVAVLDGGETAPAADLTVRAAETIPVYCVKNLSDYTDGGITWVYNPAKTKSGSIPATLTVTDNEGYQITEVKIYKVTPPATAEGEETKTPLTPIEETGLTTNTYTCKVSFTENGTYRVVAKDNFRYTWSQEIVVNGIGKEAAKCTGVIYSTEAITAAGVRAKLVFDQSDVSIEKIEMTEAGGDTLIPVPDNIAVIQGQDTVYVKENCEIQVTFRDSYGLIGEPKGISVQNIVREAPRLVPELTVADNQLTASMTLRLSNLAEDQYADPYNRALQDYRVYYNGREYTAAANTAAEGAAPVYTPTVFTFQDNGVYEMKIYDAVYNTQDLTVTVRGIDRSAATVTEVTVTYTKPDGTQENISIVPGTEAGWAFTNDTYNVTNQNVEVVLTTDKKVTLVGEAEESYGTQTSKTYWENGIFNFALQAANKTIVSYAVGIELIDKTPPVIEFAGSQELVFVEGMTNSQDASLCYNKAKLLDYKAYDTYRGVTTELTDQVTVDYGSFDPNNINENTFDRTRPYTVTYTVTDAAGNTTRVRRTIRLVGQYDTILLINGKMPGSDGTVQSAGGFSLSLKNFSGMAYVRYAPGYYTMGQMKTRGAMLTQKNGVYTASNLSKGWYTVYVQTDKRDYFTQWVWVDGAN